MRTKGPGGAASPSAGRCRAGPPCSPLCAAPREAAPSRRRRCPGARTGPAPAPEGGGVRPGTSPGRRSHTRAAALVPVVPTGLCRDHAPIPHSGRSPATKRRQRPEHLAVPGRGRGCAGREKGAGGTGQSLALAPLPGQLCLARRPPRTPRVSAGLRITQQRPVENAGPKLPH